MTNATPWGTELRLDSDSGFTFDSALAGLTTGKLAGTFTLVPAAGGADETHLQLLNADGAHHGPETVVNIDATGDQKAATVVALANGGFVIAWEDWSSSTNDTPNVRAEIFDADWHSVGSSFALDSAGSWHYRPQIAAGPDGGFAAIWQNYSDFNPTGIEDIVRVFNAAGSSTGSFVVNASGGTHPDVAVLGDRQIVSAYETLGGLRATIHNPNGTMVGSEFAIGEADERPTNVKLIALNGGGFAAVWQAFENSEDTDIHAQIFDASGNKDGDQILVNTTTRLSQSDPHIAQLLDGRLAITWTDRTSQHQADVRLQLIDLDGNKSGDELLVNTAAPGFGEKPDITALADGRFAVSWDDTTPSEQGPLAGEHAQIFDPRASGVNLTGTPHNDDYYGTGFDDTLNGSPGDDRFDAGAGTDTVAYTGDRSQYQIIDEGDHIVVTGPEGTDALYNVEFLKFGAIIVPIGSAPPPPPDPTPPTPPAEPPAPPAPDDYVSGLFDTAFYLTHYGDVSGAEVSGFDHFNTYGWHEGRDPNAWFDTTAYLAVNKDVAASGVNPMNEYHQSGWREGRDPGPNFDAKLYLVHNPDVAAAGVDPLEHYLQHGMSEGRQIYAAVGHAVNGFDAEWYLFHNPDVAAAGVDPLQHYQQNGWHEGRNPNPWFDAAGYLAHYADVAAAGIDPLQHYEQNGWKEGRDPSAGFSTNGYLAANPDVAAAHLNPLDHFINNGIYEGRVAVSDGVWH